MNRILLDTSPYSALFRNMKPQSSWSNQQKASTLTPDRLGRAQSGIPARRRGEENESSLREFLQSPRVSVLAIDDETADRWAIIAAFLKKAGTPVASNDIWIAASADAARAPDPDI